MSMHFKTFRSIAMLLAYALLACASAGCTTEQDLGDAATARCASAPGPLTLSDGGALASEDACADDLPHPFDDDAGTHTADASKAEPEGCDPDRDGHFETASCPDAEDAPIGLDCDEGDAFVHANAAEACDGVDQDCDGRVDEERMCAIDVELSMRAQAPEPDHRGSYEDVAIDADGNAFLVGVDLTEGVLGPVLVESIDASGATRWERRFGEFHLTLDAHIAVAGDRLYMMASIPQGITLPVNGEEISVSHGFVAAFDTRDGAVVWVKPLDWPTPRFAFTHESLQIAATSDAVFIGASFEPDDPSHETGSVRVARLDRDGAIVWQREPQRAMPHAGDDLAYIGALAVGAEQLFITLGLQGGGRWDDCETNSMLALDFDGRCNWSLELPDLAVNALAGAPDGGVVVVGHTYASGVLGEVSFETQPVADAFDAIDAFVARVDRDGTPEWVRIYGGGLFDHAWDVALDAEGRIHVALELAHGLEVISSARRPAVTSLGVVAQLSAHGETSWMRDTTLLLNVIDLPVARIAVGPADRVIALASGKLTTLRP